MNGGASGANGVDSGSSGGTALTSTRAQLAVAAALGGVALVVNATSQLLEAHRDGRALHAWEPFVWEGTSYLMLLALAPLVWRAVDRWPPRLGALGVTLAIHAGLSVAFSIVHVVGMMALRLAVYAAVGDPYSPFTGGVALTFLYEWRKDALAYAALVAIRLGAAAIDRAAVQRATAAASPAAARVEIRDGAQRLFLDPGEIVTVEAAGNYVEITVLGRTHLVRGALAAYEERLSANGIVRIHRSRLVNRAHVRAVRPTAAGDLEIELTDGRTVAGSRRYRAALMTPNTAP